MDITSRLQDSSRRDEIHLVEARALAVRVDTVVLRRLELGLWLVSLGRAKTVNRLGGSGGVLAAKY